MVKYASTEEKRSKAVKLSCRVMNTAAELCTFSSLTVEVLLREHCCAGLAADQLSHNMHSDIFAHVSLGQGGQPGEGFKPGKTGEGESYQQTCNRAMDGADKQRAWGDGNQEGHKINRSGFKLLPLANEHFHLSKDIPARHYYEHK